MTVKLRYTSSSSTHPGRKRKYNEDAFLDRPEQGLWAVADGMGGHNAGDVASTTVVEALGRYQGGERLSLCVEEVESLLDQANRTVLNISRNEHQATMGTTVAVLAVVGGHGAILWMGDSRIYRMRNGLLEQLTEDHSLVQEMISSGRIEQSAALEHPSSNVITRAVGVGDRLQLDLDYIALEPGDRLLLCSDGLYKDLDEKALAELLAIADGTTCNQTLIERALALGGRDNITSIVIDVKEQ